LPSILSWEKIYFRGAFTAAGRAIERESLQMLHPLRTIPANLPAVSWFVQ
jgi:hypothetical protein